MKTRASNPPNWRPAEYAHVEPPDSEEQRSGLIAGGSCRSENAITLRCNRNYNGGGRKYFGGAKEWPHLTLEVSFPVGAEAKRAALVKKIKALIDREIPT
jgi:hypothetical protein